MKIVKKKGGVGANNWRDILFYIGLMAFPVLQFIIFYVVVNTNSLSLTFKQYDTLTGNWTWVGVDNLKEAFRMMTQSSDLLDAMKNSFLMWGIGLLIGTPLALLFSYYIHKKMFGHKFFRVLLFMPSIISAIIMVTIYQFFVNRAIPEIMTDWFHSESFSGLVENPNTRFGAIMFYNILMSFGVSVLMYSDAMGNILMDQPIRPGEGILHHVEGVDLMPADIQLSGMEVSLVNAMSRETVLRQYLDTLKGQYSHILIDCQPSLGMLTVNALAAANRIIIPVQAEYLPAKGLEQLLSTVNKVKRQINPKLQIDGILLTMVDSRTNFAKEISALLRETYGSKIKVFGTEIPHSVRAKEISAEGKSIFAYDPGGKVAEGYRNLTKEVLKLEKQREKNRAGLGR